MRKLRVVSWIAVAVCLVVLGVAVAGAGTAKPQWAMNATAIVVRDRFQKARV